MHKFSPEQYTKASVLAREVGEEMLSRLEWMTLKPQVVLDLGCGVGEMSERLQSRYPGAHVIALDISMDMIQHAKTKQLSTVCADANSLPLPHQSVDLIFANLVFPWEQDLKPLLQECRRVLRSDGLLMFTLLGPDTLRACKEGVIPFFVDMHDVGDLMLQQKFADPVLDVDYYTLTYRTQTHLLQELQATGMLSSIANMQAMTPAEDGRWEVTYEVIFSHAFAPAPNDGIESSADGVVRIPLSHLRRQLRS